MHQSAEDLQLQHGIHLQNGRDWILLPGPPVWNYSMLFKDDVVKGGKTIKNRITVMVVVNRTGTHKSDYSKGYR